MTSTWLDNENWIHTGCGYLWKDHDGDHNCPGEQNVLWERVSDAESKVCRVERLHRPVVINVDQYDPVSNVRYTMPIKICEVCLDGYPCTTIMTMNEKS